ncbi:hypothetical protein ACWEBX_08300 [Streptomyces sp. NPDC005070]
MTATAARASRFYTSARRHPWVLGKVADWRIPLGPYTPAQIAVAVGGGFLLVKTISWWSWMGPIPIIGWALAIWAVRRPTMRGRAPMQAAVGWLLLGWQPRGGRIGGRAARDRAPRPLLASFTIEGASTQECTVQAAPSQAARQHALRAPLEWPASRSRSLYGGTQPAASWAPASPVSGVQLLIALAQQRKGVQ